MTEGLVFKRDWLARMKAKPENLRIIYAEGDSMEPYVFEGDVVLFDSSEIEPKDRQAYVIRRPDGGISIKRMIQQLSGAWMIRSDNVDKVKYPDEMLSENALHEIPILGRVIWRGGEM
ncbi:S24 family peptidase [Pseudomonas brassicacearum]|uniref:S24 family peptidase n=1 Tax=Pseudomonas brassicacearum TaxID=930166 RepID=UPI0035CCE27F